VKAIGMEAHTAGAGATRDGVLRWHFLGRLRFQLLGGILFGVLVPVLAVRGVDLVPDRAGSVENSAFAVFAALLIGALVVRRVSAYPGVASVSTVVPSFTIAFGVVAAAFLFLRIDYSRSILGLGYLMTVGWFTFLAMVEPRLRRPRFLLLPFGRANVLAENKRVDWLAAGTSDQLPGGITGVVADLRADLEPEWEQLLARAALAGLPVYHWKLVNEALSGKVDIKHISENNLGSLLRSSAYARIKQAIDIVAAIIVLPLVTLVCAVIAIAILVRDGRPVLYRDERIGFRGQTFTMYKFRTMRNRPEKGSAFTTPDDPRVTELGRFLRHYRLDELPQIINILRGEMSWIGPRPESRKLSTWYESEVPFYSYRHIVRPGISGWAQVHQGNVGAVAAATDKLRYDFYYIKYFSPWLDTLIAARTLWIMLSGFGSR